MKPIGEITNRCLELMKPHELMSWRKWWEEVVGNGEVPTRRTYAYAKFIKKRSDVKKSINLELQRRKRPERLICVGVGQGIYLVNEDDVAEITADTRVRKIVNCFHKAHKEMTQLAICQKISGEDKKMLSRLSDLVELQQNTMIGTMSKMRSLPPATKKRLLKKLGFEPSK